MSRLVEKITIQPSKIRAYGNIINNKTTEDYDRYESSLVKSLVTINGVPISAYLLVYSPNNFAFDFDGNLKHLYVSEDEDTVDGFTFDSNNKELSFTSDDVSFGFDDTNKRLYCDNEYHPTSYTVSLNVSSSSVSVGGSVTLSATVLDDEEAVVEGATVTFKVGGSLIDTATTNSSGVATLSYTCSVAGSLSFTASCNGANSTSQSVTVNKLSTSTALTTSSGSVTVGTSVTFTATVTSGGSGVNGLTVTFKDGTSTLGTGTTNSSGVATYTTNALTEGTHSITAVVTETSTYATSTSTAVSVVVSNSNIIFDDSTEYSATVTPSGDTRGNIIPTFNFDASVDFEMTCDVYFSKDGSCFGLFPSNNTTQYKYHLAYGQNGDSESVYYGNSSGGESSVRKSGTQSFNEWFSLKFVKVGYEVTTYKNGTLFSSNIPTTTLGDHGNMMFAFGFWGSGSHTGKVKNLKIVQI